MDYVVQLSVIPRAKMVEDAQHLVDVNVLVAQEAYTVDTSAKHVSS